jgi:hypothetical protein
VIQTKSLEQHPIDESSAVYSLQYDVVLPALALQVTQPLELLFSRLLALCVSILEALCDDSCKLYLY